MKIRPSLLSGRVTVPPSKSVAHRALIARALSGGKGTIHNLKDSKDMQATNRCLTALADGTAHFDCGESGSTLRFMIPLALAIGRTQFAPTKGYRFSGEGLLMSRPLTPYERLFDISRENGEIIVKGVMKPGIFELEGGISSQFVTGLLFALPQLNGDSEIVITTPLESKPYVDLTLYVLKEYGIAVENDNYKRFIIKGNQKYTARDFTVEGDYSQAAFWLTANALGSDIEVCGLNPESLQGDKAIIDIIKSGEKVIDVTDIPDLVPILAVLCCFRQGESRIVGAARLRMKESDRLSAITAELNKLGARVIELEDSLIINGVDTLRGGEVNSHNDHRIAMAMAIAATRCDGDVVINGADCVSKSYPAFFEHYNSMK